MRLLVAAVLASATLAFPPAAAAAGYTRCGTVPTEHLIGQASVLAKNVTCKFARKFVRRHDSALCDSRTDHIGRWKKRYGGEGEATITTLIRGNRRIRTNACAV
jgi:hypothetical protein